MRTKVHELMTERPRAVTPDTLVSEAAQLMKSEDVGALPVLDGDQLAGIVTDRDIVIRAVASEKDPKGMPVREVASREVATIGPDDSLSDALELMARAQVRRIPVVDEGTVSWACSRRPTWRSRPARRTWASSSERSRSRSPGRASENHAER